MRKQTQDDLREIHKQENLLEGNINRMCVTDDLSELEKMTFYAIERIYRIRKINYARLTETEE